jgi:hypothetical protein
MLSLPSGFLPATAAPEAMTPQRPSVSTAAFGALPPPPDSVMQAANPYAGHATPLSTPSSSSAGGNALLFTPMAPSAYPQPPEATAGYTAEAVAALELRDSPAAAGSPAAPSGLPSPTPAAAAALSLAPTRAATEAPAAPAAAAVKIAVDVDAPTAAPTAWSEKPAASAGSSLPVVAAVGLTLAAAAAAAFLLSGPDAQKSAKDALASFAKKAAGIFASAPKK